MQIVFYNKKCGNIHFTIEEMIQEAMEPSYYTDENGNQVEQSKMGIGYSDGTNLEIYAATQQEAQQVSAPTNRGPRLLQIGGHDANKQGVTKRPPEMLKVLEPQQLLDF